MRLQRQADEQQNQVLLQQQQQRAAMAQYQQQKGSSCGSNSNVQGVGIDARGFFVSHSDQSGDDVPEPVAQLQPHHRTTGVVCASAPESNGMPPRAQAATVPADDGSTAAPASGHPSGRDERTNTTANPLNRRRPRNALAEQSQQAPQPPQQQPSYARRMLIMQAGGYRGGATRGIGPRGGRPPPSRSLAEQREVSFTYSESSDNEEDGSDGDIVISPGSRPLPAAAAASSGGTSPHARMLETQQQHQPAVVESRAAARRSRRATRR
jgi:hypothetical protein